MKKRASPRRQGADAITPATRATGIGAAPSSAEELYRKIFEYSNDAILVIDPVQDAIVDVNLRACFMLGYSR